MNLPNKLTLLRVAMIPFFLLFLLNEAIPYGNYSACVIFVLASATCAGDGYLARKWKLITNFGKFMDPLADKLLVCSALISFAAMESVNLPAWVVIVIISREFIISGFRLIASDKGVVIAASYWGKLKTVAQMIMSVLLILKFDNVVFHVLEQVFIYISVILTIVSLVDYIIKNKQVLSEGSN